MNRRQFNHLIAGTALAPALPSFGAGLAQRQDLPKFSVMLWTLEQKAPLERCLETVAAAGYQGVEFVGEFYKWTPDETRRTIAQLRSLGLKVDTVSGLKTGFAVPADTARFFEQLEAQMGWASQFDSPQLNLLSGARIPGMDPAMQHQTAIENLKRAAEAAQKKDLSLVIEPIDSLENPTIFLGGVEEAFEIVRGVNMPNLKVLYDFYHEQRGRGNLIEKLEKNIDWVGLVHIADVPGRHEPGTGEIDYANVYKRLAALKYDRWIAMEFYPTGDPVMALRLAREQVQRAFNG